MIVIKYGGHAMDLNADEHSSWLSQIQKLHKNGERFVIVHGGGPMIDSEISARGLAKEVVGGYRVTSPEIFEVVEEVLSGRVLRAIVKLFRSNGLKVVGISGKSQALLDVVPKQILINGQMQSIGQVGEVIGVHPEILISLMDAGFIPIVSPVSETKDGIGMNVNADIVAGAIAGSLCADATIFMTDVPGIYRNWPDKSSLISSISVAALSEIADTFESGMAPKVSACINALNSGAKTARIIDGKNDSAFIAALSHSGGTLVTA
ncbi:MAG: acetylglutamate kinase [Acidobacteria bacterium]|nr:acetylglutamate kinase [Acidobacteriota bacterium]